MTGPLDGVRVADFTIMAAGPWIGALLGQLGADVLKIEPPAGDGTRWVQPHQHGMGTNYVCMNVNKRSTMLDLKSEEGLAAALKICAESDVLLQNFRGGAFEALGLGFEAVQAVNPRLIYCSVSGFGGVGPYRRERCADQVMQAFAGFARLNGAPGDTFEQFRFTGLLDLSTSIVATEAMLAALVEREASGMGQHVDVSMLEAALEMQLTQVGSMLNAGVTLEPRGSRSGVVAPDGAFAALDGEVFVTVHDDAEWRGFCAALERPDLLADPRFATNRSRVAHQDALDALVAPVLGARPMNWWLRTFDRHGVPVGVLPLDGCLPNDHQIAVNDMVAQVTTPWGDTWVGGLPWHFDGTPCRVLPPPIPADLVKTAAKGGEQ